MSAPAASPGPVDDASDGGDDFLDSVEGEIAFFRSIMRARPVGIHRYFHVLAIRSAIHKDTGRTVAPAAIWAKLSSCYSLDALEAVDAGYESPTSDNSTPPSIASPSPDVDLSEHPFFREEFALPFDDAIDALVNKRRRHATASVSSASPAPSPAPRARGGRRRGKTRLDMAGLIGGDSDSSALTQESGDEGVAPTPRGSAATGTDAGTEYADDDDVDMREPSPVPSASTKPGRGKAKPGVKRGVGRGRGGSTRGKRKKRGT